MFDWLEKEFASTPAPNEVPLLHPHHNGGGDDVPLTLYEEGDVENTMSDKEINAQFIARLTAYLEHLIGRAPETDIDIVFGIAYVERTSHWLLPHDHPVGELLLQNKILPINDYTSKYGNFIVYDNTDMEWVVRAIIDMWEERNDLMSPKIKTTKCALWAEGKQ